MGQYLTESTANFGLIPVAVQSKAQICIHLIVGIVCSNSTEGMDVCVLHLLCVV
jgi:hypothetical protein